MPTEASFALAAPAHEPWTTAARLEELFLAFCTVYGPTDFMVEAYHIHMQSHRSTADWAGEWTSPLQPSRALR